MSAWGLFASSNDSDSSGKNDGHHDWMGEGEEDEDGEGRVISFEELLAQAEAEPPLERLPKLAAVLLKQEPPADDGDEGGEAVAEELPSSTAAIFADLRLYSPLEVLESSYLPAFLKGILLYYHEAEESAIRLLAGLHHAAVMNEAPMPAAITTATVLSITTGMPPPELEGRVAIRSPSPQTRACWLVLSSHCVDRLLSRCGMHIVAGTPCWQFILLALLSKLLPMMIERERGEAEETRENGTGGAGGAGRAGVEPVEPPAPSPLLSFPFLPILLLRGQYRRQAIRYLLQGGFLRRLLSDASSSGIAGSIVSLLEKTADGRGALMHAAARGDLAERKEEEGPIVYYRCVKPQGMSQFYPSASGSASGGAAGASAATVKKESSGTAAWTAISSCTCACCISQDDLWLWSLEERLLEKKKEDKVGDAAADGGGRDDDDDDDDDDDEDGDDHDRSDLSFVNLFAKEPACVEGFAAS